VIPEGLDSDLSESIFVLSLSSLDVNSGAMNRGCEVVVAIVALPLLEGVKRRLLHSSCDRVKVGVGTGGDPGQI